MSSRPRIARVALAAACLASLTGAAKVKMDPANPTCPANPGWSANPTMTFTPATKGGAKVLLAEGRIDAGDAIIAQPTVADGVLVVQSADGQVSAFSVR